MATNTPYRVTRRDRFAYRLANWILNHVTTKQYRAFLTVTNAIGIDELARMIRVGSGPVGPEDAG